MRLTQYTIEREFPAPPEAVYAAFTDPAKYARWVWGSYGKAVQAELDLRINGILRVTDDFGKGREELFRGMYLVIEPGRRIVHTLHWGGSMGYDYEGKTPLDEVIALEFAPGPHGCMLRYVHLGVPDEPGIAADHESSVRGTLDWLDTLLREG